MRINTTFLIVIFLAMFFTHHTFGQQYAPGYILKTNGETVQGYIEYTKLHASFPDIRFKKNLNDDSKIIQADEVQHFVVAKERYTKASIDDKNGNQKLTTFLRVLIKGDKSLNVYHSKSGDQHFYIKKNNGFERLKYSSETNDQSFKGQLALYFSSCASIRIPLENITFTKKRLVNIFIRYYKCKLGKRKFNAQKSSIVLIGDTEIENTGKVSFKAGYIIKANGDTIKGFVGLRKWKVFPNKVQLKKTLLGTPQQYDITNTQAFSVGEDYFTKARVKIDTAKFPNRLTYDNKFYFSYHTVYLQVLALGSKSLYYYKGPDNIKQFYIKKGDKYELLLYKKYLKGERIITQDDRYKGQLLLYLSECGSIKYRLNSVSYEKGSLTKLFNKYFDCTQEKAKFRRKVIPTTFKKGFFVGAVFTSLRFDALGRGLFPYLTEVDFPNSNDITFGAFFEIVFPGKVKKWSVYNELAYHSYSTEGTFVQRFNTVTLSEESTFEMSYIKMSNLVRFMPKKANATTHPFINVGIFTGAVINSTNRLISRTNNRITSEGKSLTSFKAIETGLSIGLGMIVKKFTIEARHERGNGFSSFRTFKSRTRKFIIMLGMRF